MQAGILESTKVIVIGPHCHSHDITLRKAIFMQLTKAGDKTINCTSSLCLRLWSFSKSNQSQKELSVLWSLSTYLPMTDHLLYPESRQVACPRKIGLQAANWPNSSGLNEQANEYDVYLKGMRVMRKYIYYHHQDRSKPQCSQMLDASWGILLYILAHQRSNWSGLKSKANDNSDGYGSCPFSALAEFIPPSMMLLGRST